MRWALLSVFVAIALSSCNTQLRLRRDIPEGLPVGRAVYSNSRLLCSVAIYQLDRKFTEKLQFLGLSALNEATKKPWGSTPSFPKGDDFPRWVADFMESLKCIEDQKLQLLFHKISNGKNGYFQIQDTNSMTLIAPQDGLVMVGGYE